MKAIKTYITSREIDRKYCYSPFKGINLLKFFKKFKYLTIIPIIFLILVSSCKDNPVSTKKVNTETIDTIDAYGWRIDTIWGYTLDKFYVADSNNIFFMGGTGGFLRHDGNINEVIYFNDPGFINFSIDGFDKNSIFIGGGYWDTVSILKLKLWNGAGFTDYTVPNDSSWDIASVLAIGPNEAWFCS